MEENLEHVPTTSSSNSIEDFVNQSFKKIVECVENGGKFPKGQSYAAYSNFASYNNIVKKLTSAVLRDCNHIMSNQGIKRPMNLVSEADNMNSLVSYNDHMSDTIYNMDTTSSEKNEIKIYIKEKTEYQDITKPQLSFMEPVNNFGINPPKTKYLKPGVSIKIIYNQDNIPIGYEHPYINENEGFDPSIFISQKNKDAINFPSLEDVNNLVYVSTESELDQLIETLREQMFVAVDLEHHSWRSFQGFTCLIQISISTGFDYIIDALALRHVLEKLNIIFTDINILKIFHGAKNDIEWLQKDFGVYVVGLFDTYLASKALQLQKFSLQHLMLQYCTKYVDKTYQLADWRIRPLTDAMINYARLDTRYLIYIYKQITEDIKTKLGDEALLNIFKDSAKIACVSYELPIISSKKSEYIYRKSGKLFNTNQQFQVLWALVSWRDNKARTNDESVEYVMSEEMLINLAERMPKVPINLQKYPVHMKLNFDEIHQVINDAMEGKNIKEDFVQELMGIKFDDTGKHVPTKTKSLIYDPQSEGFYLDFSENVNIESDDKSTKKCEMLLNRTKMNFLDVPQCSMANKCSDIPTMRLPRGTADCNFLSPYARYEIYKELTMGKPTP